MALQALIDELYESWVNGNRTTVVKEVCSWKGAQAVLGGALLFSAMHQDNRMIFMSMLRTRMGE